MKQLQIQDVADFVNWLNTDDDTDGPTTVEYTDEELEEINDALQEAAYGERDDDGGYDLQEVVDIPIIERVINSFLEAKGSNAELPSLEETKVILMLDALARSYDEPSH